MIHPYIKLVGVAAGIAARELFENGKTSEEAVNIAYDYVEEVSKTEEFNKQVEEYYDSFATIEDILKSLDENNDHAAL